jgi:diaminopimelate decarboxylase
MTSTSATLPVSAPPLRPKIAPWMKRLAESYDNVRPLIDKFGSPIHVVVESEFKRNVEDLLKPLQERRLNGGLYFARKANKLPWFVTAANDCGIGIDTASLAELTEAISLGADPQHVTVTAIAKTTELISTAVQFGALLIIDNNDELNMVDVIATGLGTEARVGIRFSGFVNNGRKIYSRFGFPVEEGSRLLERVCGSSSLKVELLHAHLDRYDPTDRAAACRQLIALRDRVSLSGIEINKIDIGGGILMRYLDEQQQFESFLDSYAGAARGEKPSFLFRNGIFDDLYPAWNDLSKERFIAAILDQTENQVPLHEEIRSRHLEVYFEPGRALLDNAGVTLATVSFRKRDSEGNLLIGLTMNRMNLRPFRAEFCSDPTFICNGEREPLSEGAFLVGNLCSESDLIYRRKINVPVMPEPGDIVCFYNTAGYLAHHMEIGSHGDPLPINVLLNEETLQLREFHC